MKKLNKHKILSAACIAALPLLVVACLEFDGIIQPGRALTDSEIEVTAQLRVSPGEDGSGKVVFAVLAPKAWNLRDNATLYLTTKDYNAIQHQPEVVNEQLTLMPAEEKDPKNGLSWADSFMSVIGRGGNDPQTAMEWVVWRSSTTFIFDDKIEVDGQEVETADVHADVRIKMKTGAVPLTCELGYSYCYDTFGLKRDEQRFAEAFKPIETYNQVFTTTPSVFRYGDVFGITFSHGGTALKDAGEVYLCGTAIHDGGQKAGDQPGLGGKKLLLGENGNEQPLPKRGHEEGARQDKQGKHRSAQGNLKQEHPGQRADGHGKHAEEVIRDKLSEQDLHPGHGRGEKGFHRSPLVLAGNDQGREHGPDERHDDGDGAGHQIQRLFAAGLNQ